MANDAGTMVCFSCGGIMRHETRDDRITYKNQSRIVPTWAWWCTNCDEAIFYGEPLAAHAAAFRELKTDVDGGR